MPARLPIALAVAALIASWSPLAHAQLVITSPLDAVADDGECTLREAIRAIETGLPVHECPAGQPHDTIVLATDVVLGDASNDADGDPDLDIAAALHIVAEGPVTLSPAAGSRVFDVAPGAVVGLVGLRCDGLDRGTCLRVSGATVTGSDLVFENGLGPGGYEYYNGSNSESVVSSYGAALSLERVTFAGNTSKVGGAMIVDGGQVTIVRGSFVDNRGDFGGAMSLRATTATLRHTLFDRNQSGSSGGAIFGEWNSSGSLSLAGNGFTRNTAVGAGGAISSVFSTSVAQTTFSGNAGTLGALTVFGVGLHLRSSLFVGNTSSFSGRDVAVANTNDFGGDHNLFGAYPRHITSDGPTSRTDLGPTGSPGIIRYLPSPLHEAGDFAEAAVEGPHIGAGRCEDFDGNPFTEDIAGGERPRCDIGAHDAAIVYPQSGLRLVSERVSTPCAGLAIEAWWNADADPFTRSGGEAGSRVVLCDGSNFAFAAAPGDWECQGRELAVGADLDGDGQVEPAVLSGVGATRNPVGFCGASAIAPPLIERTVAAPSATCPLGGQRLRGGADADVNGALAEAEVTFDTLFCDRATIMVGVGEDAGRLAALGVARDADVSGTFEPWEFGAVAQIPDIGRDPVRLAVTAAPSGVCAVLGVRLSFGRDLDGDGDLEGAEPVRVLDVCDDGGAVPDTTAAPSPACATYGDRVTITSGAAVASVDLCATGPALTAERVSSPCAGLRIGAWLESDGAPGRSAGEVGSDNLVCDPPGYTLGFALAVGTDPACSAELRIGPGAGGLDARTAELYTSGQRQGLRLCAPSAGGVPLVQERPAGAACQAGGRRLELGYDLDEDVAVDEVSGAVVVCDTRAVTTASRILFDQAGAGPRAYTATQEITAFEDFDGDGVQQPSNAIDVATRELLPGDHALAIATRAASCAGGVVLRVGADLDGNGLLSEVLEGPVYEAELCPSVGGPHPPFIALTELSPQPGCAYGSYAVELGWDHDGNGVGGFFEPRVSIVACRSNATAVVTATSTPCVGRVLTIVADTDGDGARGVGEAATAATLCDPSYPLDVSPLAPELAWEQVGCDDAACYLAMQMFGPGFVVTSQMGAGSVSGQLLRRWTNVFYAVDSGLVPEPAWVPSGILDARPLARGATCGAGGTALGLGRDDDLDGVVEPEVERIVCQRPGLFARAEVMADGVHVALGRDDGADGVAGELEAQALVPFAANDGAVLGIVSYPDAARCPEGGVAITLAHDVDRDGALGGGEPAVSARLCDDATMKRPLVRVVDASPGDCMAAGSRLELGLDDDGDGVFDGAELRSSATLCRGPLLQLVDLQSAGALCQSDGQIFARGLDHDRDGRLSPSEITETVALCDASTEDVLIEDRPLAAVTACADGGTRLVIGSDLDRDGALDDFEITDEVEVCTRADLPLPLVSLATIVAGATCPAGGARLQTGADLDGDGALDANEVVSSATVCNGPRVLVSLTAVTTPCDGQSWRSGADLDGDGTLDANEVQASAVICDGDDGLSAAIAVEPLTGTEPCLAGGVSLAFGLDDDHDGALDRPGEVDASAILCHGAPGPEGATGPAGPAGPAGSEGADGAVSLIVLRVATDCAGDGSIIEAGLDVDGDGQLDADEVQSRATVCDGAAGQDGEDGANALVTTRAATVDECAAGGTRLDAGQDDDGDGALDAGEIEATAILCNGAAGAPGEDGEDGQPGLDGEDGAATLVTTSDAGAACPAGGIVIRAGLDEDRDGTLDPEEVSATETLCAGEDGGDGTDGVDGEACTLVQSDGGATLTCPDGTSFDLSSQASSSDGGCAGGSSGLGLGLLGLALLSVLGLRARARDRARSSGS
ncbi:MAG: hypothetical protein IT385_20660 [Deltaproteobacteria bacterium]|nr:hypothetical protein [Deltaproteobacteria bacterium]